MISRIHLVVVGSVCFLLLAGVFLVPAIIDFDKREKDLFRILMVRAIVAEFVAKEKEWPRSWAELESFTPEESWETRNWSKEAKFAKPLVAVNFSADFSGESPPQVATLITLPNRYRHHEWYFQSLEPIIRAHWNWKRAHRVRKE